MKESRRKCTWRVSAVAVAILALTLGPAPSATADAETYLYYVQRSGIPVNDRNAAVEQGRWICQALASGQSVPVVTQKIIQAQTAGALSWNQGLTIVGLARTYLC